MVQVPAGCVVRVAGVGGNTVTGLVGNGGIVEMPDPYAVPPICTFTGGTVIDWTLYGDLSFYALITPPTAAIQFQNGSQTAKIMSYNKNYRSNPVTYENSNPSRARSKGRVHVNYVQGACNNYIEYDILKSWTTPNPQIVGANCWAPSTQYVYAVDIASGDNVLDAIGFDKYYWQVLDPNGLVVGGFANNSAESSSIVFTTPGAILPGSYTIQCCFGQSNPWNNGINSFPGTIGLASTFPGGSCVTKPIQSQPGASGAFPTCIPLANTSWPLINVTPLPGYTYTYSSPCAWVLTPSGGQGEDLTITAIDDNPCTITQTMVGPCGTSVFQYVINRSFDPSIVLAPANLCVSAGGSFTLNLPPTAQGNCTTWSGVTWPHTGNGTHATETFNIPTGTPAGPYTIVATSCAPCTGSISIVVRVKPTLPVITGLTCVPFGTGPNVAYTCTTPPGATPTDFAWSNVGFTPPWQPFASSTTNSITYIPTGIVGGTVRVTANATSGCPSGQASLLVCRTPQSPVVAAPLCFNVGVPGTATFSVSNPQGACSSYTWTFPTAFSASGGTSGTSVTRTTTGTPGTYLCSVTNTTANCGTVTNNFNVVVAYGSATVTATEFPGFTSLTASPLGQQSYTLWNCNTQLPGAVQTNPPNPNPQTFTISTTNTSGLYSITILTTNGCLVRPPCAQTDWIGMVIDGGGSLRMAGSVKHLEATGAEQLLVSPNPNTGTFNLQVDKAFLVGTATLYDAKGATVGAMVKLNSGRNELGSKNLAAGVYTLNIELDGEMQNRAIVVVPEK